MQNCSLAPIDQLGRCDELFGMEKKVRFGDLVRNSGRPQTVTLWTKPEKNPALTKAIKQNRVLTLIQEPGKRDYGLLGFKLRQGALYLVFPRPLPREQNARVIGINFQLVEEPVVTEAERAKERKPSHEREAPKPVLRRATTQKFTVNVRRTATLESEFSVDARDKEAAKRQAVEAARKAPFELSDAKVRVEVVKTD